MRAMTYTEYGTPDVLSLNEVPTPKVGPGTVLIRVQRAAVNPVDWKLISGGLDELMDVFFPAIPGWDVAGVVEAVGPDVPEFSVGDPVASYARKDFVQGGTFAEFVSVPAESTARIPEGVDVDSAAGLPLVGLTAQRSLEMLDLTEGDTLLIHAASGGVGHVAAQLAMNQGVTVIGTASEANQEMLRARGVTPVNYGEGLPERVAEIAPDGVTAVADFVGGVVEQTMRVLTEGGRHVSVADPSVEEHGGRWVWVRPDGTRLQALLDQVAQGLLSVDIDMVHPLEQAVEALQHNQRGARGKILIDLTSGHGE